MCAPCLHNEVGQLGCPQARARRSCAQLKLKLLCRGRGRGRSSVNVPSNSIPHCQVEMKRDSLPMPSLILLCHHRQHVPYSPCPRYWLQFHRIHSCCVAAAMSHMGYATDHDDSAIACAACFPGLCVCIFIFEIPRLCLLVCVGEWGSERGWVTCCWCDGVWS